MRHKPPILAIVAAVLLAFGLSNSQQGSITVEVPKCSTDGQYPAWSNSAGVYQCTSLAAGGGFLLMANASSGADTVASNTTVFTEPGRNYRGDANMWVGSESTRGYALPYAGTIDRLAVVTTTAQPAGNAIVITVRKNGASSTVTLTIAAGTAAGVFTDNTHSFSVAAGDRIAIQAANATGSTSANFVELSVRYTPTIP